MSPFSPSSPESSHPHPSGESFSEAFLNTSSVRDSLPEQYRVHFDELRGGILAFCHEFEIPVETLRSKEDFGKQLASAKIPSERMEEVVLLFEQLEHLIANREPLGEKQSEAMEYADRLFNLTEQYRFQVTLLEQLGILKDYAIMGIDDHEYPIPTLERIAQRLYERRGKLETKHDQGFTKLLLVPFGTSLDTLQETFKQFLLAYKQTYPDFDLDINEPLWTWEEFYIGADIGNHPNIVYNPHFFDHNHQGQTKADILEAQADNQDTSFPGWRIHLFQPSDPTNRDSKGFVSIPRQGQGEEQGEENPRPDIEANRTPTQYLSILQQAKDDPTSPYFQESGLTPEDWIFAFITHLTETGEPLDNYDNGTESATYLTGVFFPSIDGSAFVPYAYWDRGVRRAYLYKYDPGSRVGAFGTRSSVIV